MKAALTLAQANQILNSFCRILPEPLLLQDVTEDYDNTAYRVMPLCLDIVWGEITQVHNRSLGRGEQKPIVRVVPGWTVWGRTYYPGDRENPPEECEKEIGNRVTFNAALCLVIEAYINDRLDGASESAAYVEDEFLNPTVEQVG